MPNVFIFCAIFHGENVEIETIKLKKIDFLFDKKGKISFKK